MPVVGDAVDTSLDGLIGFLATRNKMGNHVTIKNP